MRCVSPDGLGFLRCALQFVLVAVESLRYTRAVERCTRQRPRYRFHCFYMDSVPSAKIQFFRHALQFSASAPELVRCSVQVVRWGSVAAARMSVLWTPIPVGSGRARPPAGVDFVRRSRVWCSARAVQSLPRELELARPPLRSRRTRRVDAAGRCRSVGQQGVREASSFRSPKDLKLMLIGRGFSAMERQLLRSSAAWRERGSRTRGRHPGRRAVFTSARNQCTSGLYIGKHQKVLFAQDPEFSSELDFAGAHGSRTACDPRRSDVAMRLADRA